MLRKCEDRPEHDPVFYYNGTRIILPFYIVFPLCLWLKLEPLPNGSIIKYIQNHDYDNNNLYKQNQFILNSLRVPNDTKIMQYVTNSTSKEQTKPNLAMYECFPYCLINHYFVYLRIHFFHNYYTGLYTRRSK